MLTIKKDSLKYRDPNTGQFATVGMLETTVYTDGVLPIDPVEVDKTLTVEGAAADAKATGDALNTKLSEDQVREVIDEVLEQAKESGEFNGEPGQSFVILGVHSTEEELKQKVASPKQGDHYNVGPNAEGEYDLYMYDVNKGWINKGSANGGTGTSGTIIDFGDDLPQALGVASAGVSDTATRSDHVHPMPTAKDVGALFVDEFGAVDGQPAPVNADTLGGIPASSYVQKGEIPSASGSLPEGGTAGQILTKNSDTSGDASWQNPPTSIPSGGEKGQVLTKNGSTDGDASWQDAASGLPEGGTAGQVLYKKADGAEWKDLPEQQKELPEGGTAGQILTKTSSGGVEWTNKLELDTTLKASNKAADAKATGDAINQLKEHMVNVDLEEAEGTGDIVRTNADLLAGKSLAQIMLMMYPVGAIYTSTVATSPETLFGGKWESIGGRFLLGAGGSYAAGSTGGEETVTILDRNMPYWALFMGQADQDGEWSVGKWSDYSVKSGDTIPKFYGSSNAESSVPLNNMPPYLAVYMWERTE